VIVSVSYDGGIHYSFPLPSATEIKRQANASIKDDVSHTAAKQLADKKRLSKCEAKLKEVETEIKFALINGYNKMVKLIVKKKALDIEIGHSTYVQAEEARSKHELARRVSDAKRKYESARDTR
jgi:hypothetical protein